MTPGQDHAIAQSETIVAATSAINLLETRKATDDHDTMELVFSLFCGDLPRADGGLKLRDRERFIVSIGKTFPYAYPRVRVEHLRFAEFPHVQWGQHLCLYVAPQTEWNPTDGMFGFLSRLESWLRSAALNELDPVGGALHPPVAYTSILDPLIVIRANAPVRGGSGWIGLAKLEAVGNHRLNLIGWHELDAPDAGLVAAAILLEAPMPFEFPRRVEALFEALNARGVSFPELFKPIGKAIIHNGECEPLYVVVGTPMRGIRGGETRQHLTVWRIDPDDVKLLNLRRKSEGLVRSLAENIAVDEVDSNAFVGLLDSASKLHVDIVELVKSWAKDAKVNWCRVREARDEVTMRRDISCPMEALRGKSVEIWGCGALGSHMAEYLVRGGIKRLKLRDSGFVAPGVLVRQLFDDEDIGRCKAQAAANRLRRLGFDCEIEAHGASVLTEPLGHGTLDDGIDLIIDATASRVVHYRLEDVWRNTGDERPTICSVMVDASASFGMVAISKSGHSGCSYDVLREVKLELCRQDTLSPFLEAFYPSKPAKPFQPEPGCSDATFVGSEVDIAALSAIMLNAICEEWSSDSVETAAGWLVGSGKCKGLSPTKCRLGFHRAHRVFDTASGYEVRISGAARKEMMAWAHECHRTRALDVETGGILFGDLDGFLKVLWVTDASGPPPDSTHSAQLFLCGVEGTRELGDFKRRQSRGSVRYLGTWHTHPVCPPIPSGVDLQAADLLLGESADRVLLVILGTPMTSPRLTASVFEKEEFDRLRSGSDITRVTTETEFSTRAPQQERRVGLTLSGGGSRAMAYHLGCLRALHDRGLLPQIDVVSTVSGGSVIGAMYAYSNDSFESFDNRVCTALRRGFVGAIARETFLSPLFFMIVATTLGARIPAAFAFLARKLVGAIDGTVLRRKKTLGSWSRKIQPPFRRWRSRTDAFAKALSRILFAGRVLGDERRGDINVVINACELRTGTAFRFGNRESGTWTMGTIENNDVEVALAVAASAAYPVFLPALDRQMEFVTSQGGRRRERVILTDGGVYENLGISCMAPSRSAAFSTNVYKPEYIICCDAGKGALDDTALPFTLGSRLVRSFDAIHRQVQHGLQSQVHLWRQSGLLSGFVYSYLGQQDHRLPYIPAGLVRRSDVEHYPTDFSPMSDDDRALLARRGYQLTRVLIDHYCPEL